MRIAAKHLETEASYRLITGIVVPRPIAWVTTLAPNGGVNLTPFSMFTSVSPKPPLMAISVGCNAGAAASNSASPRARLIIGEVVVFRFRDGLVRNGKIATADLDPIARIGGPTYARLGEIISLTPVHQTAKKSPR